MASVNTEISELEQKQQRKSLDIFITRRTLQFKK